MSQPSQKQLVWLVTGCTSGFGKLFVSAIIARGDKVIATARNTTALAEFADTENVHLLELDITASQDTLNAKTAAAIQSFGQVDVLVNNAGYVQSGVWEELSHENVLDQFNTNLFGQLNITRAFLPHFRVRGSGTIVFMSSIAAWMGVAAGGPYSASKFALEGAVESLQKEVLPLGIKTHLVVLGQFRTNILSDDRRKLHRPASPIPDYDGVVDVLDKRQAGTNGKQPGDPGQAVERVLDLVRGEGWADGKDVPLRIVLGSDAAQIVRAKCVERLEQLDQYSELSRSTDFPGSSEIQDYK